MNSFDGSRMMMILLFRAVPAADGGFQARGRIGATAVGLYHSSWQHRILNPLSEAGDRTSNFTVTSRIHFCCAATGTPRIVIFFFFFLIATPIAYVIPGPGIEFESQLQQHQIL